MVGGRPRGRPLKPLHLDKFLSNAGEVDRLLAIHEAVAGSTPGRKHKVEVLNKSGIVLLIARWEAFVEDIAEASFKVLLRKARSPDAFPVKVRTLASKPLKTDKDERRVWELAGQGWKEVLKIHGTLVVKKKVGTLNTPRPAQVDDLFSSLIGLTRVSSKWSWPRMTPHQAKRKLDQLVTLRGSIAHRVSASKTVFKKDIDSYSRFITRLAIATHNAVDQHILKRIGYRPWGEYEYQEKG